MKVLITGSDGFIGNALAELLVNRGFVVYGIDNLSTNRPEYYLKQFKGYTRVIGDINTFDLKMFNEVDVVIHAAAIARIPNSNDLWDMYYENNVLSTLKITQFCRSQGIRLLYISSSSVISDKPLSAYSETKLIGEKISKYNPRTNIIRLFNVYGKEMPKTGKNSTLIGRLMRAMDEDLYMNLNGDGSKVRDFTNIEDVCNGIEAILNVEINKELYEIGTGNPYSIMEVFNASRVEYKLRPELPFEAEETMANNITLRHLNWKPKHNIINFLNEYRNGSN